MKDKLLTTILAIIALSLLTGALFFLPLDKITDSIPFLKDLKNNSSLIITGKNNKLSVEIDGEDYGETPLVLNTLPLGQHKITLKRISTQKDNFYEEVELLVELNRDTEAVIEIEIAPAGVYTGYVLQYTTSPFGDKKAYLSVTSNANSTIVLDGKELGASPLTISEIEPGERILQVSADGYEDLEIPLVATKGFNLNVSAFLYPIPMTLDEVEVAPTTETETEGNN